MIQAPPEPDRLNLGTLAWEPGSGPAWFARGQQLAEGGAFVPAAGAFRRAAALMPTVPETWLNAATTLQLVGSHAQAISLLERALELSAESPEAHYQMGGALFQTGRADRAGHWLRRAIVLRPAWAECHSDYAATWSGTQRPDHYAERRRWLGRAVAVRPNWFEALYGLGVVLTAIGKTKDAEKAFREAVRLSPNSTEARYMLAQSLIEEGQSTHAAAELERVVASAPGFVDAAAELRQLKEVSAEAGRRSAVARYPKGVEDVVDLKSSIRRYLTSHFRSSERFVSRKASVFALGSCFAENITRGLVRCGVAAEHVGYPEEINSPYANRYLLEWIRSGVTSRSTEGFDRIFGSAGRDRIADQLRRAGVVILSLGVAPCFFDRETNEFVSTLGQNFNVPMLLRRNQFRTTTVQENVDAIQKIIETARWFCPDAWFVLTVSPVPLKATFEMPSAVMADCVSKSTLRVAAHEVLEKGMDRVIYWPSFEMVRWLVSGHIAPAFGVDDGSSFHVSQRLVDTIIELFIETFGEEELSRLSRDAAGS